MLNLLQTPHWSVAGIRHDLPATLPGWMLAFLAVQGDWVSRDRLLALLWPDAGVAEAQHSLRVNLHRVRQLLVMWAIEPALLAERRRVRVSLPTDVAQFRQALTNGELQQASALYRCPLLDGMNFPGFPVLQEWAELERALLQSRWREALMLGIGAPGAAPAFVLAMAQRLLAFDPLDDEAMLHVLRTLLVLGRGAEAVQTYEAFRARLQSELGVGPSPALQELGGRLPLRAASTGGLAAPAAPVARDAFIGREIELKQLQAMLGHEHPHVVTLLGPGGVGKSRLARDLCARLGTSLRDGAGWVALSDLQEVASLWPRVSTAIGLGEASKGGEQQQVLRALAASERLLVFDNAEHLAGFDAALSLLVSAAPAVRWLVTSRTPLGLPGERVFALEGLSCPEPESGPLDVPEARGFDAVRLLESRVLALTSGFDLAAQLAPCVALLQRVGGWPLAIELAAHALATQPAADVLADLEQSLETLAAAEVPMQARHASMRASLQLSWRLLSAAQRAALARLSVFRGGFTRAAALEVAQCDGAVFAALVDRLLVHVSGGGRFDLHPLVAQFAAEQLSLVGAPPAAGELHARHFVGHLHRFADRGFADWDAAARSIEHDFENFRTAWHWALNDHGADLLAPAARAWSMFSNAKGRVTETTPLIEQALARSSEAGRVRAPLLLALANLRYRGGDLDTATGLAREAVAAARTVGDAAQLRAALNSLALPLIQSGGHDEAQACVDEALAAATADHAIDEVARLSNSSAMLAKTRGDFAKAAVLYQSAITIHRRLGHQRGLALCLNNLGNVFRARGDLPAAQQHFEECLRICELHGIHATRAFALSNLGLVAYAAGRMQAARVYADRTLAEPSAEPAVHMAATALLALTAIAAGDLQAAAQALRQLATQARAIGLRDAILSSIIVHAKWLIASGQRGAAAARLSYVIEHPHTAAIDRGDARRARDAMGLSDDEAAEAERVARGFDIDVLLDAAVNVKAA